MTLSGIAAKAATETARRRRCDNGWVNDCDKGGNKGGVCAGSEFIALLHSMIIIITSWRDCSPAWTSYREDETAETTTEVL